MEENESHPCSNYSEGAIVYFSVSFFPIHVVVCLCIWSLHKIPCPTLCNIFSAICYIVLWNMIFHSCILLTFHFIVNICHNKFNPSPFRLGPIFHPYKSQLTFLNINLCPCDYFFRIYLQKYNYWAKTPYGYFQVAIWKICIHCILFNSVWECPFYGVNICHHLKLLVYFKIIFANLIGQNSIELKNFLHTH